MPRPIPRVLKGQELKAWEQLHGVPFIVPVQRQDLSQRAGSQRGSFDHQVTLGHSLVHVRGKALPPRSSLPYSEGLL